MRPRPLAVAVPLLLAVSGAFAAGYAVLNKVPIKGDGGWDYITADSVNRRLYVSHGSKVDVLNLDTLETAGVIRDTPGVHGVAVDTDRRRGFVTCGREGRVDIFDLRTLEKTASVNVGQNPDALVVDPATGRAYVFNGRDHTASVIDGQTVLATFPVGGRPEFAVTDGRGTIFVNLAEQNNIAEIDTTMMKMRRVWKLEGCDDPTGLAFDPLTRRLFSACGNRVLVESDADKGKVVASVPIGGGADGVVFDADRHLVFVSNGEGTVTQVVQAGGDRLVAAATIETEKGARTVALDPKTHTLYLPTAEFGAAPDAAINPRARAPAKAGSFHVLVVGEK